MASCSRASAVVETKASWPKWGHQEEVLVLVKDLLQRQEDSRQWWKGIPEVFCHRGLSSSMREDQKRQWVDSLEAK